MIPKIIHYCWFGGNPLPKELQDYINTWKEKNPDYEIKCWNESNYDYTKNEYMKQAFEKGKWGFVSDSI
ncbi:glycosyl transferase, partial [Lactobacillus salivarius]|nr:glycosyl transferase [Ligilactobacillus salivarius]